MQGTLDIAKASDLVILPTGLSLDDMKPQILLAHELTSSSIPEEKLIFTLCRVGDGQKEIEEARQYINKSGYSVLAGSLPEKTAYRRASDVGKSVSEVSYLSLRIRAEEVAQSIIDKVNK